MMELTMICAGAGVGRSVVSLETLAMEDQLYKQHRRLIPVPFVHELPSMTDDELQALNEAALARGWPTMVQSGIIEQQLMRRSVQR